MRENKIVNIYKKKTLDIRSKEKMCIEPGKADGKNF